MRILGVDFGAARTGVAVSDDSETIATPLTVVEHAATPTGLERIRTLVEECGAEQIVVGLPLTLGGERGEQARRTEAFVAALRAALDVPVATYDERFTTALAAQVSGDAPEDARAAAHLLESYLTWKSARPN